MNRPESVAKKIVTEAYDRVLDEGDGRIEDLALVEEEAFVEVRAAEEASESLIRDYVEKLVKAEDEKRTKRGNSRQTDLFSGEEEALDGVWALGDGSRVKVRRANRRDWLQHVSVVDANAAAVLEAARQVHDDLSRLLPFMDTDNVDTEEALGRWRQSMPADEQS